MICAISRSDRSSAYRKCTARRSSSESVATWRQRKWSSSSSTSLWLSSARSPMSRSMASGSVGSTRSMATLFARRWRSMQSFCTTRMSQQRTWSLSLKFVSLLNSLMNASCVASRASSSEFSMLHAVRNRASLWARMASSMNWSLLKGRHLLSGLQASRCAMRRKLLPTLYHVWEGGFITEIQNILKKIIFSR